MELIERLNEKINELERQVESLQQEKNDANYKEAWNWRHLRIITEEENYDLPVPRLELRFKKHKEVSYIVDYGLVYRHLLGSLEFVPISSTRSDGIRGGFSLPYRDTAHIWNDKEQLNLPAFAVDTVKNIILELKGDRKSSDQEWRNLQYPNLSK